MTAIIVLVVMRVAMIMMIVVVHVVIVHVPIVAGDCRDRAMLGMAGQTLVGGGRRVCRSGHGFVCVR